MGKYEKVQYVVGKDTSVLQCNRLSDKTVNVRPVLPGNVIVIHGVNDVGTSYNAVEQGLCEGLKKRIGWQYVPGEYRMPAAKDKGVLQDDPDAVFFKRRITDKTASPVIPFYWGYRETKMDARTVRGQRTDRYGNRLDKDLSKGGGPFANATSTLPDMWGRGKSKVHGLLDYAQKDATHPVLDNPGHLYMILAARRMAALISMIRDYDDNEAVTIVAHSQGCLVALLAQAFLLDDGLRPADTLILNNPPYSLVDEIPMTTNWVEGTSGQDERMRGWDGGLAGRQTLHARLQTLVNIVHGVVGKKHTAPAFAKLDDQCVHHGMVSGLWKASADRDNRGKVYLYFCPEDMTVALNNVQGIGWQGVPDFQRGKQVKQVPAMRRDPETRQIYNTGRTEAVLEDIVRQPFRELTARNAAGAGFYQRVFSMKKRPDAKTGKPVLIGQPAPHDFILRTKGEDDQAHTDTSDTFTSKKVVRAHFDEPARKIFGTLTAEEARAHVRTINGEPLPVAVEASMLEGARTDAKGRAGGSEDVDPIDAAIAVTSDYGIKMDIWQLYNDPTGNATPVIPQSVRRSPAQSVYAGFVHPAQAKMQEVKAFLNKDKPDGQCCQVLDLYDCVSTSGATRHTGQILVCRSETPDEARLRWQQAQGARSFHGAIFGGAANHRQVTAFDIAIGGGKASSDPLFYKYLCAVADWRLQRGKQSKKRPSIMHWETFLSQFASYWKSEPAWRKDLIEGNAAYYSSGNLPMCVPTIQGMPSSIVFETLALASLSGTNRVAASGTVTNAKKEGT